MEQLQYSRVRPCRMALPFINAQDTPGLLNFKAGVAGAQYCNGDTRVCAIFNTWQAGREPCQVPNCIACTLEHSTCGVFQPSTNTTTCAWRYIECANGRVTKLLLGEAAFGVCARQPKGS